MKPVVRIIIADDETMMLRLVERRLSLEPEFQIVAIAEDGRQLLELALEHRPDLVVTDLNMPHLNGFEAIDQLRASLPHLRFVMLTAMDGLAAVARAYGITEVLSKRSTPEELVAAVRRAAREPAAPRTEEAAPERLPAAVERLVNRYALTPRERVVLEGALDTELTLKHIAGTLSREAGKDISESAVKHALSRIMDKLQVEPRTRAGLVRYVLSFAHSEAAR